jgi:biotin-[acetyl-CoA-carboxylase] ligase BirA-like protein
MMPRMWASEHLDSIDSTQREALRRLEAYALSNGSTSGSAPFVLWTTCQTQGIGSHGRRWTDSGSGLALSLAWPESLIDDPVPAWPIRCSLMVVDCLVRRYPQLADRVGVKWPNDIMAGRAKLGGVLVSRHRVAGQWWLIAGIGLNLAWQTSAALDRPVTDLESLDVAHVDPAALVADLVMAMHAQVTTPWTATELMQRFSCADIFADVGVSVTHPMDGRLVAQGKSRGISEVGALRLQTAEQLLEVQIGELSLRESEATL